MRLIDADALIEEALAEGAYGYVDAESHCKLYPRCYGCNAFRNPTNADRIRSMSDEELAMCLYEIGYDEGWDKPEYALKWLRQPAEED